MKSFEISYQAVIKTLKDHFGLKWSEKKVFRRLLLEIHHHPAFCSFMCIDFVILMHCKVSEFSEKRCINKNVSFITMNGFPF